MKIKFLFPGKTKEKFYAQGIDSYLKRLAPMVEAREVILKSAHPPGRGEAAEAQARALESSYILGHCEGNDFILVCDVQSPVLSSEELAGHFDSLRQSGVKTVNLVVGGPWGLDDKILARADLKISFGPMTFPHELARLILMEQVYRAFTIINHIPYHK